MRSNEDLYCEVIDFINRRWLDSNANWFNGNCYWFAHILSTRFLELKIYYLPIDGHFIAGNGFVFFDAAGQYPVAGAPCILFDELKETEPSWYDRIIQDCVN